MTPPLITVLTAVRNGARHLPEAIASIRAQSVTDWEHVIVDDASDDGSAEIVEREAAEDGRIVLVRRATSEGPYVAANDGLRVSRGSYIARLDADDVAVPDRLVTQLEFLAENDHLRACGGFHHGITGDGMLLPEMRRVPAAPGVLRWRLCLAADPAHSSAFVERAAFEEIGGYEPLPLAQDWRMWCRLAERGWLGIVPALVVYRRIHGARLTVVEGPRQAEYANEVARDHIRALGGGEWTVGDVRALRGVAHDDDVPLRTGLRVVNRWAALWRGDASLTGAERRELATWTKRVRRRHVRARAASYAGSSRRRKRSSSGSGSSP